MSDWQLKTHCMYLVGLAVETPEGTARFQNCNRKAYFYMLITLLCILGGSFTATYVSEGGLAVKSRASIMLSCSKLDLQ